MADPDPPIDDVADVAAVGQRRLSPGNPFPERPDPVTGPLDPDASVPDEPLGLDPCDDPEMALDWNADAAAAAAEALRRIIAAASARNDPTHNLANREYGAMICERADGALTISPIVWGDPIFDEEGNWLNPGEQPTVPVNINACGAGNTPLAMIHTHPSTGSAGAIPSWNDAQWVAAINNLRSDQLGRIHVVAIQGTSFRIEVYDQSNVGGWETGVHGPEVNPDAQPCNPGMVQ